MDDDAPNTLLTAASYLAIEKHEEATGEPPTGFHFNKYLSLLHREIGAENSPLRLPHCWYRWGDEVARQQMPNELVWNHAEPPAARVSWEGKAPPIPDDDVMKRVSTRLAFYVEQYADAERTYAKNEKLRQMIAHVYSYAPFQFQRDFRDLREAFIDVNGSELPVDGLRRRVMVPTLERALATFPDTEMPALASQKVEFQQLMLDLFEHKERGFKLAGELSEAFWFLFCYHLRVHPRARQNISATIVKEWQTTIPEHEAAYERVVQSLINEAANTLPRFGRTGQVARMVAVARRQEEEDFAFINQFDDVLGDLGKFSSKLRQRRLGTQ